MLALEDLAILDYYSVLPKNNFLCEPCKQQDIFRHVV